MVAGNIPANANLSIAVYEAVQAGQDDVANLLVLITSVVCVVVLWQWARLRPDGLPRDERAPCGLTSTSARRCARPAHVHVAARFLHPGRARGGHRAFGAGKSLLLKVLAGLLRPTSATCAHRRRDPVRFRLGALPATAGARRGVPVSGLCLVSAPQRAPEHRLWRAKGWRNPAAWAYRRGRGALARRLWPARGGPPVSARVSGGQRQRTALARALVSQPRALLLDEPFAALDTDLRVNMRAELDTLQRRLGVPMVLITHDPEDVKIFGNQVLHMNQGTWQEETVHENSDPAFHWADRSG